MKEYSFIIEGVYYKRNRTFPGLNDFTGAINRNRHVGAKMKKKFEEMACREIERQLKGVRIKNDVRINYIFYEADKRRDPSNIVAFAVKVIEDALQDCKVLKNDGWNIRGYGQDFFVDKKNPRIEVVIREVKKDE